MFVEICLAIITVSLITLIVLLVRISAQTQKSILRLQTDLNRVATEITQLSNSLNEFINSDLQKISQKTGVLVGKLTDLTSDINHKSHSLNFLFKPFSFLNSIMSTDSPSSNALSSKGKTISQILKWVATSVFLIKTTRRVIKKL